MTIADARLFLANTTLAVKKSFADASCKSVYGIFET